VFFDGFDYSGAQVRNRTHFDRDLLFSQRFEKIVINGSNNTFLNDSDIDYDVNYTYRVTAVNRIGESQKSDAVTIRVRYLTEPSNDNTTTRGKGDNRALILGIVGSLIIVAISAVLYYLMTGKGQIEPPPDEEEYQREMSKGVGAGL